MSDISEINALPASEEPAVDPKLAQQQRRLVFSIIGAGIVILGLVILVVVLLMKAQPGTVSQIRDVFIIFMAFESLVIGITLVILIVQIATLINLLQNEIKPILNSTNETVNTLRGTAAFLSDNLAEPVIKLNEYLAGLKRLIHLVRIPRR
jgi:hypothetical protein